MYDLNFNFNEYVFNFNEVHFELRLKRTVVYATVSTTRVCREEFVII